MCTSIESRRSGKWFSAFVWSLTSSMMPGEILISEMPSGTCALSSGQRRSAAASSNQ